METKVCTKCKGDPQPIANFSWKNKLKGKRAVTCKKCKLLYDLDYYSRNKQTYIDKNYSAKKRNKKWIDEYKKDLKCIKCGEDETCCLDFHHIDPKNKKIEISLLKRSTLSLDSIKKEIDKCIVVCSNCHRKLHAGLIV